MLTIKPKIARIAHSSLFSLLLVFLFSILTLFTFNSCKKKEPETIKIGAILPLTGPAAEFGQSNLQTTKFVIEKFNKTSPIKVELIVEDSKSSPKEAVNSYHYIMNNYGNVPIISTELSSISMSLAPFTQKNNQLLIAIAATTELLKFNNVFRIYPISISEAEAFLKACQTHLKSKSAKISIFYINDEFGRNTSEVTIQTLNQNGFLNITSENYTAESDFRSLVTKHRDSNLFIVIGYGKPMGLTIREIQNQNKEGIIIASPELNFIDVLSLIDTSDNRLFFIDIQSPSEEMIGIYKDMFGRSPNLVDLLVFDGLNITLEAIKVLYSQGNREINATEILNCIKNNTFEFDGRKLKVDSQGNIIYDLTLKKLKNP